MIEIGQEVYNYFYERFLEPIIDWSMLNGVPLYSLFVEYNMDLTSLFLLEELDGVVYQCDVNKILDPGGFHFSFCDVCYC